MKMNLKVKGMHCESCEMLITDSLEDAGAKNVHVSHKKGTVSVDFDNLEKAKKIIKQEGFEVI